jgi:lipopolysaccharide exporter
MTSNRAAAAHSPGRHMLLGSVWMIGLRWAIRLTGVVSTIFLARLLTPSDFGVVAMAMIFVGMLELLNQTGQRLAIIRHPEPTRAHYDTAWTLSVMVGLAIAVTIEGLAPVTRFYFHDPRVVPVMQCLAFRAATSGFENIGTVDFRRDLQFNRFFIYNMLPKLISFVVTLAFAVALRNYWALVIGMLSFQAALIVLSYAMHPYRPRFSLARVDEIWSFSFWTLFKFIGNYLNLQVDQIAIGGISGAPAMGRYSVATDVASSPSRELNDPMVAVLYPVMSAVQGDRVRLRDLYIRTLCWSAIICASASVGVTCVAHDMVRVLLGPKWVDVEPLMGWLALSAGVLGLSSGAYTTFDAIGMPHLGARMQWVRLMFLVVAIAPVAWLTHNLQFIAATRLVVTCVFMPNLFFVVGNAIGVSPRDYAGALWRPFAAAAAMGGVILLVNAVLPFEGLFRLLLDVIAGAATYVSVILALWRHSGRPDTPEKDITEFLRSRLTRYAHGLRNSSAPLPHPSEVESSG